VSSNLLNVSAGMDSLLGNVPSPLDLPPEENSPARLASLTYEEAMSALLHESGMSVHGVSGSAADLHVAHRGVCCDGA
jgi:hypothetical protein